MKRNNMCMYMVTHKPVNFVPNGRTPIFVGKGENKKYYLSDSTGDNISNKNRYYSELTALYWIWKNDTKSNYVSIEHYRRFFMDPNSLFPKIISKSKFDSLLIDNKKIVVPQKQKWSVSIGTHYKTNHSTKDYNNVVKIIQEICPEYLEDFNKIMNGHEIYMFNMMGMPKEKFDEYCKWLFSILFKLESVTDLSKRSSYQQRAYGFMSERLFNVWIKHNISNDDIVELPVYYLTDNKLKTILKSLKARLYRKPYVPVKTTEGLTQ